MLLIKGLLIGTELQTDVSYFIQYMFYYTSIESQVLHKLTRLAQTGNNNDYIRPSRTT